MRRAVQFLLETTKHKAPFARRKRKHSFPYVTLPEAIQPTYPSPPLFLNVVHDTLAWMVALRLRKTTGPSTPQDFQWRDSASSTSCVKLNRATPSSDFSSTPVGDKSAHGCYFGLCECPRPECLMWPAVSRACCSGSAEAQALHGRYCSSWMTSLGLISASHMGTRVLSHLSPLKTAP